MPVTASNESTNKMIHVFHVEHSWCREGGVNAMIRCGVISSLINEADSRKGNQVPMSGMAVGWRRAVRLGMMVRERAAVREHSGLGYKYLVREACG